MLRAVLYCHFIGLVPGLFVWLALFLQKSVFLALVYFEGICLILLPSLLLAKRQWCNSGQRDFRWYYKLVVSLSGSWRSQIPLAVVLAALIVAVLSSGWFLIARSYVGWLGVRLPVDVMDNIAKTMPLTQAIISGLWFSFINPILEELFWRIILAQELLEPCVCFGEDKARDFSSEAFSADIEFASNLMIEEHACLSPEPVPRRTHHQKRSSEATRWLISSYYAAYHVVVVTCFSPPLIGVVAFISLTITGRILLHILEMDTPIFGLITSIILHAGLDISFAIIAADYLPKELQKYMNPVQGHLP